MSSKLSPSPDPIGPSREIMYNEAGDVFLFSPKNLRCPDCSLTLDRDVNAAVNIVNILKRAVESARTGPSGANVGRWAKRSLKSSPL